VHVSLGPFGLWLAYLGNSKLHEWEREEDLEGSRD